MEKGLVSSAKMALLLKDIKKKGKKTKHLMHNSSSSFYRSRWLERDKFLVHVTLRIISL
jgi:hypothetical protein